MISGDQEIRAKALELSMMWNAAFVSACIQSGRPLTYNAFDKDGLDLIFNYIKNGELDKEKALELNLVDRGTD